MIKRFYTKQTELYENLKVHSSVRDDLDVFIENAVNTNAIIAFDIETTGLDYFTDKILLAQFYTHNNQFSVIVDVQSNPEVFIEICQKTKHLKYIGVNIKFDYKFCVQKFGKNIMTTNLGDLMINEILLTNGYYSKDELKKIKPYSLRSIIKKYKNIDLDKTVRESFINKKVYTYTEQELIYADKDVIYLHDIYDAQTEAIKNHYMTMTQKLEEHCIPVYADIELAGMSIDINKWKRLANTAKNKMLELKKELDKWIIENGANYGIYTQISLFDKETNINWGSPKQVAELFEKLGFDISYFDHKKEETTKGVTDDILTKYQKSHIPIPQLLKEWRVYEKKYTSYGEEWLNKFIHKKTGKVHPEFKQLGTATGRVSCLNPNLQQIPGGEYRDCFIASSPDRRILTLDYSQAEIRIVASASKDDTLMSSIMRNEDPYGAIGTKMFGVTVSKTENKDKRQISKAILLGKNYGSGAETIAALVGCEVSKAQEYLNAFDMTTPKLNKYLKSQNAFARTHLFSRTLPPFNRKCFYNKKNKSIAAIGRNGQNQPIQGTNADIVKLATYKVWKYLREYYPDACIINQVHDEIVVECDAKDAEVLAEKIKQIMIDSGAYVIKDLIMDASYAIDHCWSKD